MHCMGCAAASMVVVVDSDGIIRTALYPFLSLCSFLLTMTEVICWSMKRRIVKRIAGTLAAK